MTEPRVLNAGNRGPFTLDGSLTYIVGRSRVAIVDPGPDLEEHVRATAAAVSDAERAVILQTHDHDDHAGASACLADRLRAPVLGAGRGAEPLSDGEEIETDAGRLVALETPGHAARHLCFHWPRRQAVFVGDLMLGEGETTWLGAYRGCVEDYFRSLDRVGSLDPRIVYPGHGPPIREVGRALERYRAHRAERLDQLRQALDAGPGASPAALVRRIYGDDLDSRLVDAAERSVEAMLHHLRTHEPGDA